MFNRIIEALRSRVKPSFDPAVLNDRIALMTEWTPLARGGANFKTHKLVQVYSNRFEFRTGAGMIIFAAVFAAFGLIFPGVIAFSILSGTKGSMAIMLIPAVFGLIFLLIGITVYRTASVPRVFDKDSGYYWKGRTDPNLMLNREYQNCVRLPDIHAVQIIPEWVRGNKSSYTSYELNLVLKDGKRLNVIDHGNVAALRTDAEVIAGFLQVPVWDAS